MADVAARVEPRGFLQWYRERIITLSVAYYTAGDEVAMLPFVLIRCSCEAAPHHRDIFLLQSVQLLAALVLYKVHSNACVPYIDLKLVAAALTFHTV